MKRIYVIPLAFLLMISLACSIGSFAPKSASVETKPTSPFEATKAPEKAEPAAKKISEIYDDFTTDSGAWGDTLTVTTQAQNGADSSKVSFDTGQLVFSFLALETYAYRFYRNPIGTDVVIEAKYQAFNQINNGIAVVCRAANDRSAWYEFRVSSTSMYNIFLYDRQRKEKDGLNPYLSLKSGGINVKTLYPTKENVIQATCKGSTLSLGANGTEIVSITDSTLKKGDEVGLGAMSTDILPVNIKFDYFSAKKP
jgi:hypothetical protein